jgi:hypothetical protein
MKRTLPECLILGGVACTLILTGSVAASRLQKANKNLLSVYITFQEFLNTTSDPAYPSQGARLQLHNKTRWPIYYTEHYDPTVAGPQISYVIELEDGRRAKRRYVDTVDTGKLMPGRTLSLVVPRGDFPKGSKIYIEFYFSWETKNGERISDEAVHRAYFLSSELPEWPRSREIGQR